MKKGFTLIELLAVIIILAILTTLIVPKVVNMLDEAEKNTNMTSAQNLAKAAEYKASNNEMTENNQNIIINYTTGENTNYLEYTGDKPEKGQVIISSTGEVAIEVKIGDNCYLKSFSTSEITSTTYSEETCKITASFENDSWNIIKAYGRTGYIPYEIGDTKQIKMDIDDDGNIETYTVRLANMSSPEECKSENFSQTACGIVIEFTNILMNKQMQPYPSTNLKGWPETELYEYLNTTFYNKLPIDLKNELIDTYTISGHGTDDIENITSVDKIYLLTTPEIYGNTSMDSLKISESETTGQTRMLDYYKKNNTADARKKTDINSETKVWWLRSAISTNNHSFNTVGESGYFIANGYTSQYEWGVSPAFRISE